MVFLHLGLFRTYTTLRDSTLIATLEDTLRIQEEGHARRMQAEQQITRIQGDLKRKLIDLRGSGGGQIGPGPLAGS